MVQVHDLVDFVSEEAERAGAAAAAYIQAGAEADAPVVELAAGQDIGYTVPQRMRLVEDQTSSVSFRVRRPMGKSRIVVACDGEEIRSYRRQRMAPGEMEHIKLAAADLVPYAGRTVEVRAEEVDA